jgi:hypothetical protein
MKATRACSVSGCDSIHYGKGFCQKHYHRERRTGDASTVRIGHRYEVQDAAVRLAERSEWRDGCLIYTTGYESRSGHVMMGYLGGYQGVHRVAYAVANGPIPDGCVVRHKCDAPRCINPAHLELGTVADNNRDRDVRGRHVPRTGSRNAAAKLTAADIPAIRLRLAAGESMYVIAAAYQVTQGAIWSIRAGRTWRHA